jgi:hypothetical protein
VKKRLEIGDGVVDDDQEELRDARVRTRKTSASSGRRNELRERLLLQLGDLRDELEDLCVNFIGRIRDVEYKTVRLAMRHVGVGLLGWCGEFGGTLAHQFYRAD